MANEILNQPLQKCPMFGEACRHCSMEHTTRPFTKIVKDPNTKLFKPIGLGNTKVPLGEYCNNVGAWVRDLHYCPARWALRRGTTAPPPIKKKNPRSANPSGKHKPTTREKASGAWKSTGRRITARGKKGRKQHVTN